MEEPAKGTVMSLSSLFPAEEAQKASKRVQDTMAERQRELGQLRDFIADNTSLINLVQRLPDELHHEIMVPFGKAAFFPGRLIHTNEFLVLLGEGYYAERTSKQTNDILRRRGKALEAQVESIKAVMQDLKAEASFFDATAAEATEGLVEIREEYTEETSDEKVSNAGPAKPVCPNFPEADSMKAVVENEEYARIMSRIDELEKEELAADNASECDEDEEYARMMSGAVELQKKELAAESVSECDEDEHAKAYSGHYRSQHSLDHKHYSEGHQLCNPPKQFKNEAISTELPSKLTFQQDLCNQSEDLKAQSASKDTSSSDQSFELPKSSSAEKSLVIHEVKDNVQAEPQSKNKAFTGSIVERTHNLEINLREQTTTSSKLTTPQNSKPVSRFKMQRR